MAWGPNANTEDELERLAAVREYFHEQFPGASIRDVYDPGRLAQIFSIEPTEGADPYIAVVSTEFLDDYPPEKIGRVLIGYRVAEHAQSAAAREVVVTSWGVEDRDAG
jgi:hypothetical protein